MKMTAMLRICLGWVLCEFISLHCVLANTPLINQLRAAKHDSTRLRLCVALAREYHLRSPMDSILYYAEAGFQLSQKINTTQYHSKLYTYKAFYYRSKKQYDNAIQAAQQAIAFGKKYRQFLEVEYVGYLLAVIYADKAYQIGRVEMRVKSIRQLFENIRFCYQHQRPSTYLIQNYALLAEIYKENGNDSLGYLYLKKYLDASKPPQTISEKAFVLVNNVELFLYQKRRIKAQSCMAQLLDLPMNLFKLSVFC